MDFPQTITEAREQLESGSISSADLVEHSLSSIEQLEPHLHAWLEVLEDEARVQAKQSDRRRASGTAGALEGIPVGIKDVICTVQGHTRAASRILENFRSPYAATVVDRLEAAGAVIIGKTNCDEFAMGSSGEYSAYGASKNPWDTSRVPGGSSSGSAAAVASGQVLAALGTDTGGSIRLPASFCGVVGVKPTYGRVSRFGVIAYGSSLDQVGPFARTVKDAAMLLEVLAGRDDRDATSLPAAVPTYTEFCGQGINGLRIGVPKEFFGQGLATSVKQTIEAALEQLEHQGARLEEISLPLTDLAIAVYYILAKAEASTNLARYDALRYGSMQLDATQLLDRYMEARGRGFGPEVKRAILMGTYALSAGYYDAWYKQASRVRTLIRREYEAAFERVAIIAGPVAPETAFALGSKMADPLTMYLSDALTVPISVAGVPALSVPCGVADGLPVGLQLVAPHLKEERLFQVAYAYEQSQDWYQRLPTVPA